MWLIALDIGDVRVGVALCDLKTQIPLPHATFNRAQGEAERKIIELCCQRQFSRMLVGLPLNDDGSENEQCKKVRNFSRRLSKRINVELEFIDEYSSSTEAMQRLQQVGVGRVEEGRIDALAASILIERYLEDNFNKG